MPTDFKLPELGENVTAGDVVRVLVSSGDTIAKDQPLLELETDKATIEVPSTVSGTVRDIHIKAGERVKVGQTVLTVDEDGAGAARQAPQSEGAKPKPQPAGAPQEGGLSQKAPGAPEAQPAPERADEPPGRQKPRGEVVEISRGSRPAAAAAAAAPSQPGEAETEGPPPPAAPSVRRLARELGVDIRRVAGTGAEGRISAEDVQAYVRAALSAGGGAAPAAAPDVQLPDFSRWGEVERKPMSNIRRKTAEHLSRAWTTIPHVTQHDKADITALEALRKQYSAQAEKAGGKLTMTAIALKVVAAALRRFPQFNSSMDSARNEIVYRKSVHIGVAADTERGLLVPVVREVDRKGLIELSVELAQLSEKARAGKLSLEEMQGGGFSISNLGGIGGTAFTPIVNWPEVAILGISRGAYEPVWKDERFEPRLMLPLSLSYDHRVIDGADAARFLRWVAEAFEQPFLMQLYG
ncbi:MAG TPA: 2-oxo acid dehydrogenase subunit E2 [Vicinamibacterales bacterium]|nr:2-oxo acid dehydrogenase subunit E2 [Vicinamibacterales bacterium]